MKSPSDTSCDCEASNSIPFLDTSLSIVNGKINSDLYRKPSDRNKYLLPSSSHPPHTTKNIPFSLALRIIRICSDPEQRDKRLSELSEMLLSRDYPNSLINSSINQARQIPREEALKKVIRNKQTKRPIFVVTFDPRLPSITKILKKHWRTMVSNDPSLKETFPAPPLVAYRRPKSIKDKLIRSKVPKLFSRPKREIKGMKKCLNCPICPFVVEGNIVKATATNATVELNAVVNCQTSTIIYCITCKKCKQQYIGQSERSLQARFSEHRDYAKKRDFSKACGAHFSSKGHSVHDMSVSIIEKVHSPDELLREERESMFIKKFNSKYKGINKQT